MLACYAISTGVFSQNSRVHTFISQFANKNNFNGTILIKKNTNQLYRKSFGFANIPFKIANTIHTKYKIASITKAFTSVLILQLCQEGKIDLDKTIHLYLPGYTGPAKDKVIVRQLLNMTSGMRNMETGTTFESVAQGTMAQFQNLHSLDEMVAKYCSDSLVNTPGSKFDYNNAEYILLTKIIENVTAKSYEQVLRERILQPLNMTNTGLMTQEKIVDSLADTYFLRDDIKMLVNDFPVFYSNWYGAGAMYSTINDIEKFADALFGDVLINKEMLKQLCHSGLNEYGLGVWVYLNYDINGRMYTIVKRPGSIMGAQAMLFHILEENETIIILSNTFSLSLDDFAADIAKKLIE